MDAGYSWKVTLTPERLAQVRERLEWALQRQNARLAQAGPGRIPVRKRQIAILVVAPLGLLCLLALALIDASSGAGHPLLLSAVAGFFVVAFAAGLFLPRVRAGAQGFAGRTIAKRAARTFRQLESKLPVEAEYALLDGKLSTRLAALRQESALDFRRVGLVLHAPEVLVLFRSRHSLSALKLVHAETEADHRAVLDSLTRLGVPSEELTGPMPGYSPVTSR